MKTQHGAALTETFVLMLVLTPIMFGIPMIGKLIDLRQTTVQASRYSAWEATVSNTTVAPNDVKARFFSDASVAVGGDASAPNALWGDDRDGQALTELQEVGTQTVNSYWGPEDVAVRLDESTGAAVPYISAYDSGASGNIALKVQEVVESKGSTVANLTDGEWIDSGSLKSMLRSEVRADVQGNGWFETLSFNDATVIMYDNWSAAEDGQAAKRARSFVPAGALGDIGDKLSVLGNFPMFGELKEFDGAFGYVDMNPLPAGESPFAPNSRVELRALQNYEAE